MSLANTQFHTTETQEDRDRFLQGVKDCVPTLLGYFSIGIAAGVVQKTAGLSFAEITLMCLLLYAGSAQFIAVGLMASGSSAAAVIITVFFVNLRYFLLSAAISPVFRHLSVFQNMLVGALLSDETFGVAIHKAAHKHRLSESWMHGLNVTAYVSWWIANLAGAALGQWITSPETFGLDFALTGMFIGLLVMMLMGRGKLRVDLLVTGVAVLVSVGAAFVISGSVVGIIVATVVAATVGMVVEKWK